MRNNYAWSKYDYIIIKCKNTGEKYFVKVMWWNFLKEDILLDFLIQNSLYVYYCGGDLKI